MSQAAKQGRGHAKSAARRTMFLRASIPDFIIVAIASAALVFTVSFAFESAPLLRANPLVCLGLVVPMLLILFAGSWSKRALLPSAIGAVVYAVIVLAVLGIGAGPGAELFVDGHINDAPENPVVFGMVAMAVPVVVYLLSRRRVGVIVLLVASMLACGFVQFMYRDWIAENPGFAATVVVLLSVGALFVFQSYRSSVYGVQRAGKTAFLGAAGFSALLIGICLALAAVVFFVFINGLGLQTVEVKPFQDRFKRPVVEYSGICEEQNVNNPDLLTSTTNDNNSDSNQNAQGGSSGQNAQQQSSGSNPISMIMEQVSSFSPDSWVEGFQALNFQKLAYGTLIAVLLIVLLAVLIVLLQQLRRWLRLRKLEERPRDYRIWYLYTFLLGRLERLGFERPKTFTPLEFALGTRADLAPFMRNAKGADFLACTLAYQRACYAPETLSEEDEETLVNYYKAFFGNARRFVGTRRWLWKFWRI